MNKLTDQLPTMVEAVKQAFEFDAFCNIEVAHSRVTVLSYLSDGDRLCEVLRTAMADKYVRVWRDTDEKERARIHIDWRPDLCPFVRIAPDELISYLIKGHSTLFSSLWYNKKKLRISCASLEDVEALKEVVNGFMLADVTTDKTSKTVFVSFSRYLSAQAKERTV